MLFREIIAVYRENHTEHINTLCGENSDAAWALGKEADEQHTIGHDITFSRHQPMYLLSQNDVDSTQTFKGEHPLSEDNGSQTVKQLNAT